MTAIATHTWRVMISSTMIDLPAERQIIRQVITEEGLTALYAEDPHPDFTGSAYDLSVDYAASCDLYVLIVGARYGSRPPGMPAGDTHSVTHLEFDTARQANPRKIRIILPLDADALAEDERQRAFLNTLRNFTNGYAYYQYDCCQPGALAAKAQQVIREWQHSDEAGRDAYMGQVNQEYATFQNPVTGAVMRYEATISLRLRTQAGPRAGWEAQMDAGERRRLARLRRGDAGRRNASKDGRDGRDGQREDDEARLRERVQAVAPPLIAQVGAFLTQFGRLVLLGDPGAGKSTLLRRLAHDTAQDYFQRPAAALIPIVLRASDLGGIFVG